MLATTRYAWRARRRSPAWQVLPRPHRPALRPAALWLKAQDIALHQAYVGERLQNFTQRRDQVGVQLDCYHPARLLRQPASSGCPSPGQSPAPGRLAGSRPPQSHAAAPPRRSGNSAQAFIGPQAVFAQQAGYVDGSILHGQPGFHGQPELESLDFSGQVPAMKRLK